MLCTNDLEQLMQKVAEDGWATTSLDADFTDLLLERFKQVETQGLLQKAMITESPFRTQTIRNDLTYWLEKEHHATEAKALKALNQIRIALKDYFRISLSNLECHFALYPPGHFYKKHIDQTTENNKRFFSFVIYLNPNWSSSDGGILVGYKENQRLFEVMPYFGKMIIFRSDITHEVEVSHNQRRSIAGWFRV